MRAASALSLRRKEEARNHRMPASFTLGTSAWPQLAPLKRHHTGTQQESDTAVPGFSGKKWFPTPGASRIAPRMAAAVSLRGTGPDGPGRALRSFATDRGARSPRPGSYHGRAEGGRGPAGPSGILRSCAATAVGRPSSNWPRRCSGTSSRCATCCCATEFPCGRARALFVRD
jgi:hypothetical protein